MSNTTTAWKRPDTTDTAAVNKWAREWPTLQQAKDKEQERKLLRQLERDYQSLNERVISVRQKAPPGLITNETLGNEYRALEKDVQGAAGLELQGIKSVLARVSALREKASRVETVFESAPNAFQSVAWGLGRKEPCVLAATQRMRDAVNAPVPDQNAWKAAAGDLETIRPDLDQFNQDRPQVDDAPCLKNANKSERQALKTARKRMEDTATLDTPDAFSKALQFLQSFAELIRKCTEAQQERENLLKKPRSDRDDFVGRIKIGLQKLTQLQSDYTESLSDSFADLMRDVDAFMDGEVEITERTIRSTMDRLKSFTERVESTAKDEDKRVAEERQQAADRNSYKRFKFNNSRTWVMQPMVWDPRIKQDQINVTGADNAKLIAIGAGQLGDHGDTNPVTGFAYHCHMRDNGGGGISFAYHHLGGNRVQPVIYDWATKRQDNIYEWRISGTSTNKAVAKPGWVKADTPPKEL